MRWRLGRAILAPKMLSLCTKSTGDVHDRRVAAD
jgi:hypothetical protein